MKRYPIIYVVVWAIAIAWSTSVAGQSIHYSYDASGNRILRTIVISGGRQAISASDTLREMQFEDLIGNMKVLIYPNPTKESLLIEIHQLQDDPPHQIMRTRAIASIYSVSGILLMNFSLSNNSVNIDLSGYPDGVYLLKIATDNQSGGWRIVKE